MLLEEALPVCPEDPDTRPPQPSTLPTPSRREVKQGQKSIPAPKAPATGT